MNRRDFMKRALMTAALLTSGNVVASEYREKKDSAEKKEEDIEIIDIFSHIYPQSYLDALGKRAHESYYPIGQTLKTFPTLVDVDARIRHMDESGTDIHVVSLTAPPIEVLVDFNQVPDLTKIANDGIAGIVAKHPSRLVGVANLPWTNPNAAMEELERIIKMSEFKGVQIFSEVGGKPVDLPELMPLYEKIHELDIPLWLHPARGPLPDYKGEERSKYFLWQIFGWPYSTTLAMSRFVFSGILEKLPNLKIITHHMGAMVPYLQKRPDNAYKIFQKGFSVGTKEEEASHNISKLPSEYYRLFYNDTAVNGAPKTIELACDFFGVEKVLFGTDYPYDPESGAETIRETIKAVKSAAISKEDKEKIFSGNARRILKL